MAAHSQNISKRLGKKEREKKVLFHLVRYFLRTGKPVGSQSLQESELCDMSSATIRNYFVALEKEGYLKQQHTSGGRIPQPKAFREYAHDCFNRIDFNDIENALPLPIQEDIELGAILLLLQETALQLSLRSHLAVVISSPRFDYDVVRDLRFVFLDTRRTLVIIMTEFGMIHTVTIYSPFPLSQTLLRKADRFARSRIFQKEEELPLFAPTELEHIRWLYQEAMSSYFVNYSAMSHEDLWKSGFSQLLQYQDFEMTESLSAALSLFENNTALRGLIRETIRAGELRFWVGEDLLPYVVGQSNCSCIAIPYSLGTRAVGSIAVIGSMRLQYFELFRLLRDVSAQLSSILTICLQHHRISYRMPESHAIFPKEKELLSLEFRTKPQLMLKEES